MPRSYEVEPAGGADESVARPSATLGLLEALVSARADRHDLGGGRAAAHGEVQLAVAMASALAGVGRRRVAPEAAQQDDTSPVPGGFARLDLVQTLECGLARDGCLLSAGEHHVVRVFRSASNAAQALYARLLARVPGVFWIGDLSYEEIDDIPEAANELVSRGLAWRFDRHASARELASACSGPVLRDACRHLGRPVSGARAMLAARCADADAARLLRRPALRLRHRGLMRRLLRLALLDGRGRLDAMVLSRLGHRQPAAYSSTRGAGVFPTRGAWRSHEAGLALRRNPTSMGPEDLIAWLERERLPSPWRQRLAGRRHAEDALYAALRARESSSTACEVTAAWERMLAAGLMSPGRVVARLALAYGRDGRSDHGIALCERWMPNLPACEAYALETSARRLGRAGGKGFRPLRPLAGPRVRRLQIPGAPAAAGRPRYEVGGRALFVEHAVVACLAAQGRVALHGESSPWSTLFGVLFRDILFAPVYGMLPGPMLRGPLDLGTPGFRRRRANLIEARLDEIRGGAAPRLVEQVVAERGCEDIRGVHWRSWACRVSCQVTRSLR